MATSVVGKLTTATIGIKVVHINNSELDGPERGRCPMGIDQKGQSVLVVGYDGSEPAQRALAGAAELLRHRAGRIEVVFVAHMPSTVAFSAGAVAAVREGMDVEED